MHLCVIYRELNKITVKDNFPAPLVNDCLNQLRSKNYFTKLNLKNGFHHVRVSKSPIKYTSFVQFAYLKMPLEELTNAPRVFQ